MKKLSYSAILFFFLLFALDCQTVKTDNVSGIWETGSKPKKLTQKGFFSWGVQAYNPLATLNIDLGNDPPYISAGSIIYLVKEVLWYEEKELAIIIIEFFNNNKERKIFIKILNDNEILVINDIFYSKNNTSSLYTRVPIDREVSTNSTP